MRRPVEKALHDGEPLEVSEYVRRIASGSFDDCYQKLRAKMVDRTRVNQGADRVLDLISDQDVTPFVRMMIESGGLIDDENKFVRNGMNMVRFSNCNFHDTGRILHLLTVIANHLDINFNEFAQDLKRRLVDDGFVDVGANLLLQLVRLALDVRGTWIYRDETRLFEVLYRVRRVRRIVETMYENKIYKIDRRTLALQKPLVMQLQQQLEVQSIVGLSMWTQDKEHSRMMQNEVFTFILNRLTFRVVGGKHFAIICTPAKIIQVEKDARGLPLPRYALATLEFRSMNTSHDLYMYNGLVNQAAQPVLPDGSLDELSTVYRLALSNGLVSSDRELQTRFLLIAGEHVPDDLLDDYISNHVVKSGKYMIQAKEAIRVAETKINLVDEMAAAVSRVKKFLRRYDGPQENNQLDIEPLLFNVQTWISRCANYVVVFPSIPARGLSYHHRRTSTGMR